MPVCLLTWPFCNTRDSQLRDPFPESAYKWKVFENSRGIFVVIIREVGGFQLVTSYYSIVVC